MPRCPRFENREAWGSLSYDGADKGQKVGQPAEMLVRVRRSVAH
jgi:hypothetical protein